MENKTLEQMVEHICSQIEIYLKIYIKRVFKVLKQLPQIVTDISAQIL